ncbi:active regulator of SIRT1 isoform X2 [Aethina tumida]|nr:active regulator of SIRT1 isoform X2 [Aethina tumida]
MSASLVRQALELVDPSLNSISGKKKKTKRGKEVFQLISDKHKLVVKKKGQGKGEKINLLSAQTKYTVVDAKKEHKSKKQLLKENLAKLKQIQQATKINLDKSLTKQIIERGVLKRPVKAKPKRKPQKKTAFTEEDFKRFEEEYFE